MNLCGNNQVLAGCGLGDERADHFSNALKENVSCESLDLSFNRLSDEAVPALTEMLEANRSYSGGRAHALAHALSINRRNKPIEDNR